MKESDILGIIIDRQGRRQGRLIQPNISEEQTTWALSSSNSTPTRATAC